LRGKDRGSRSTPPRARPLKYSKWRAAALGSVYVLFGVHIAHWKLNGSTLAPLELNEVMYTLEAGVVTAGFLLMATLIVATAFVGRFFCSWACHIMALEDLCSWLLGKLRIRTRPVRSRLLFLVPTLALLYMFVWPQFLRIYEGRPPPELRILGDEDGWASFVTNDFWRNLPDPWIAGLTFAVCGFAVVYFLGSRSFCLHACPYGAVFAAMDRIAPGRIKLTGNCEQCGICTGVCSSHVRVHEEIARYGKVVDPNCMKDLDCVSACPQKALSFGFTRPAGLDSFRGTGRRKTRYDFSVAEELAMAAVFLAVLMVFRGLYNTVPFLMTLGLACIAAYLTVLCLRLAGRPDVRLVPFRLKRAGKLTGSGRVFALSILVLGMFSAHSAYVRYHEALGQRAFDRVSLAVQQDTSLPTQSHESAVRHLTAARKWGLFHPLTRDHQLASLHLKSVNPGLAEPYLRRIARDDPQDLDSRLALAQLLLRSGRLDEAETEEAIEAYRNAAAENTSSVPVRMELGQILAESGRYSEAATAFREAASLQPNLAVAHYNLGASLQESGDQAGAIEAYRKTLALVPDDVPTILHLGLLFAGRGDLPAAAAHLGRVVDLQPDTAQAHFNLAVVHQRLGDPGLAERHYRRAAELDPVYAEKVRRLRGK
jgi:tetratricopeptide (TPR) repeat protein/NAD-dependent dihydropyrimidine dehydrogenase PreA subunit